MLRICDIFSAYYFLKVHLHHFLKIKSHKSYGSESGFATLLTSRHGRQIAYGIPALGILQPTLKIEPCKIECIQSVGTVDEYKYLNAVSALLSRRLERSGSRPTYSTFTRRQLLHPPVTSSPRYNIETSLDNLELSFTNTANYFCEKETVWSSVADPGCLSWIPDPNFFIPDSGSRVKKISGPGSASKSLSIFNPKSFV